MAFCKNCGTELDETTHFCQNCGAPVNGDPEKKAESLIEINFDKSQLKDVSNKISDTAKVKIGSMAERFKALGKNKRLFLMTAVCIILSIILTCSDIFEAKFLFTGGKYSSFGLCEFIMNFRGFITDSDERAMMNAVYHVLQSAPVLMGISVVIMAAPIVLNKKYKGTYIAPAILFTLFNFFCQAFFFLFTLMLADESASFNFGLTTLGILFFIETFLTIILSIKLGIGISVANRKRRVK